MSTNTLEINTFFDDLNEIYDERHRYSLEWAFEDAQNRLDTFKTDVIDKKKLKSKCNMCKKNNRGGYKKDLMACKNKVRIFLRKQSGMADYSQTCL